MHYKSNHPLKVKLNTAKNHFLRAKNLSSGPETLTNSYDKICSLLKVNGYPLNVIDQIKHEVMTSSVPLNRTRTSATPKLYLTLPFLSDSLMDKCSEIVKKCGVENIMVSCKPGLSLKNYLVSSQFSPPKCHKKCLSCIKKSPGSFVKCDSRLFVYELCCKICKASYIGQSYRHPHDRIYEHCQSLRKQADDKSISTHFLEEHSDLDSELHDFDFKILKNCLNYLEMLIMELILGLICVFLFCANSNDRQK